MCCNAGVNVLELLYELIQLFYYAGFACRPPSPQSQYSP